MTQTLLSGILFFLFAALTSCGDTSAVEDVYSGSPIRRTRIKANFLEFEKALNIYKLDTGELPSTDQGLWALAEDPGVEGWKGPYLTDINADPWRRDYIYTLSEDESSFAIASLGPDGEASEDDIVGP